MPSWWDRFGQEWAAQGLTDDPTFAQADAGWAFIGQAPPTVEQFNTMFQWVDDKDNWLYGQIANCIIGAGMTPDSNDLTQLWTAIKSLQRRKLSQDTAFYVDSINGNDVTGDGTTAKPWKTIAQAVHIIYTDVDLSGHMGIIQLRPGNYDRFDHWQSVNGTLMVQGDPLNPRQYVIKSTDNTIAVSAGAILYLIGVSIEATYVGTPGPYTGSGTGIFLDRTSVIVYDNLAFGPCTGAHIYSGIGGEFWPMHGLSTTYAIYGGAKQHMLSAASGYLVNGSLTVTLTNNPTFTDVFYSAGSGGGIYAFSTNYVGTAVGKKYYCATHGLLITYNLATIPGTIAGTTDAATYGVAI